MTDARLRSYDGLPLTIPEVEGEIGWGATPMFATPLFEPWQDAGWEAGERLRISNGGKTATAMLEMTCVAAMGESTFSAGLHAWTVIIEVSRLNYGGAICIGVTDANPSQERRDNRGELHLEAEIAPRWRSPPNPNPGTPTLTLGGWSCGFNPYCGAFFVADDAYKVNYSTPAHSLMNGDLQGKANKAAVTVMVDMDQRQLAFSINGGPSVLATKSGGLPSTVRPWVHLFKEHDSVTITAPQAPSKYAQGEDSFGGEHGGAGVAGPEGRRAALTSSAPSSYMSGPSVSGLPASCSSSISFSKPSHDHLDTGAGSSGSGRSSHASSESAHSTPQTKGTPLVTPRPARPMGASGATTMPPPEPTLRGDRRGAREGHHGAKAPKGRRGDEQ